MLYCVSLLFALDEWVQVKNKSSRRRNRPLYIHSTGFRPDVFVSSHIFKAQQTTENSKNKHNVRGFENSEF